MTEHHSPLLSPIIVIDAVFFQLNQTGIARVWRSLLEEWVKSGFSRHLVVVDRDNTAPRFPGIEYRTLPPYDYRQTGLDAQQLQTICDEVEADIFISTYYTTPLTTPSVFMAHDMIPEVIELDLSEPCWREKHYGILAACYYLAVSQNTASDLRRFYPYISPELITVANCGVAKVFSPGTPEQIQEFRAKYNIVNDYFLLVGSRLSLKGYKNALLFFQALSKLEQSEIAVVCVGGAPELEPKLVPLAQNRAVHLLSLEDEDLRLAYSGAIALVYPSLYEGFGLPIVEAMACGCPVITCANSSLPEVAGKAALYVGEDRVEEMIQALENIQIIEVRQRLISKGFEQVKQFSWKKMAETIATVLLNIVNAQSSQQLQSLLIWQEFRKVQTDQQQLQEQYKSSKQQIQTLEALVAQLQEQQAQMSQSIRSLEKEIAYLLTTKAAIRQLIKVIFRKLGLFEFVYRNYQMFVPIYNAIFRDCWQPATITQDKTASDPE